MLLFILFSYTIPFDSPIMDNIEYLQIKGLIDMPSIKPYEIEWLVPQITELLMNENRLNKLDRKIITSFSPFLIKDVDRSNLSHLKIEYQKEPSLYYGFVDGRLGGRLTENITYAQALRFRIGSVIDSIGPRPWRKVQAYLNEGFIKFDLEKMKFYLGRRNFLLNGNSEYSLLLSPDPQGYDGFLLVLPSQYYEFYNIFAVLDPAQQRFISIHRLGLNLQRFFKLGFTEALLFGPPFEPLYLNFFLPYYLAQWGINRDDNIMWGFDGQLNIFNSIIYGEFLIDDYMYEPDSYPNKLAFQVGIKSLLAGKFLTKINYTFVDKWVYTHHEQENIYERNGLPLGFFLGDDVDELSFSVKFMNGQGLNPSIVLNYIRKGEGSIFLPFEQEGGTWTPAFPSGMVEKKLDIKFCLDYNLPYNLYLKANIGRRYWYNYNHISGNDPAGTIFDLSFWMIM